MTSLVATPDPRASGPTQRPKSSAGVALVRLGPPDAHDPDRLAGALGDETGRAAHPFAPQVLVEGLLLLDGATKASGDSRSAASRTER